MSPPKHPCDCCGHRTLDEPSGRTGQICPVCFWEDSRWLELTGEGFGGPGVDLDAGQRNFLATGVCHPDFADAVRPASDDESPLPGWQTVAERREVSAQAIRRLIHHAFKGVSREGGVSLHETDAIDGYYSESGRAEARAIDTDGQWTQLKHEDLCSGRLQAAHSFFDAIGYRYHLPAYLMCWLDGHAESSGSAVFDSFLWEWADMHPTKNISKRTGFHRERLELLNVAQRYVVARFLDHLARFDPDCFSRDDAKKALGNYWQTVLDAGPPEAPA